MSEKQDARHLLTVAVPTYNGAKTIRNMLDILLPQVDERVEVLISDNCSTDETPQIIAEYREKYPYIKYVRNEENIGADGNFLQCARMAGGRFVMLVSDDDIVVENSVQTILAFLAKNQELSLVYMDSVAFTDKYTGLQGTHRYRRFLEEAAESFTTTDKKKFLAHCLRYWGFTSCFIWNTERVQSIENLERFFGTFLVQDYLIALCSDHEDDLLGYIKGPCIAVGEYGILGNYDIAVVEGINYHKMIEFATERGYDKKQFEKYYIWKICSAGRRTVIKQRAIGNYTTKVSNLIRCTWNYPYAWVALYPFLLIPVPVCRLILKTVRKIQGRSFTSYVNRPTEEVKESNG